MSLDDKLREIVQNASDEDGYVDKWSMDSAVAQIKQAFEDEGYIKIPDIQKGGWVYVYGKNRGEYKS